MLPIAHRREVEALSILDQHDPVGRKHCLIDHGRYVVNQIALFDVVEKDVVVEVVDNDCVGFHL